ncbi:MAG: shikimate kinase, partial [Pontibacterium sp.]
RARLLPQTSIADILPSSKRLTPEQTLINDFVSRMDREEQRTVLQMLHQRFANLANNHTRIALIGLRGAGKTTLGEMLEKEQKLPLVRLTAKIEELAGVSTSEVLNLSGQRGYRRLEEKALYETLNEYESCCIETGGSIVAEFKGLNILMTTCIVVWVKTSPEEHMERVIKQGDLRPMMGNEDAMSDLRAILEERTPYYEQAHITLDTTNKTPREAYNELIEKIQQFKADETNTLEVVS